jgi:hypothetical protein
MSGLKPGAVAARDDVIGRIVDVERYPILDLDSPGARAVVAEHRRSFADRGVAIMPGFVRPEALDRIASDALALREQAHLEDVWGTPYLELPDESLAEGHPRRTLVQSITWVIAYDLVPTDSPLRVLYEWDGLIAFLADMLDRRPLFRMADPLGALNLTVMDESHVQGWHYDNTDFVVSLAVQPSVAGGDFECASAIRTADDEHYDDVKRVLAGESDALEVVPMTAGTLMVFAGRNSLHRVSPVAGPTSRIVGLLAYDTKPDTDTSEIFKLVRYGRSEASVREAGPERPGAAGAKSGQMGRS